MFTIVLPVDSVRNLLLSGMYTIFVILLHYIVKHEYKKTSNIYRWAEGVMAIFTVIK